VLNRIETELAKVLKSKIRSQGPLTFRDFMAVALYDEDNGFYAQGPNIGSPDGPFDTNAKFPAFGYALTQAINLAEKNVGCPLRILELGGGTGQLGKSIIYFLHNPHEYVVFETSQGLRAHQEQRGLQSIQSLKHLPSRPTFVFGNEVLDALPVHRVMGMGRIDRAVQMRGHSAWARASSGSLFGIEAFFPERAAGFGARVSDFYRLR